jgi:putative membrane protein
MNAKVPFQMARGFLMGAADNVPGVSGGTVALVLGIYNTLVGSIKTGADALGRMVKLDFRGGLEKLREVDWWFLLPLLAGIGIAVLSLSHLIETLLDDYPVEMAAVFLGLVAGSAVIAWRLLQRHDAYHVTVLVAVGLAVFIALGLRGGTSEDSVAQVSDPALWAFFGAGAVAICAMILPGISGSFLLVMLGMYGSVLGAVNDRDLAAIGVFLIGAVIGLALFSQLLHWALNEHYNLIMAGLIGLMLGSLRVLWPWPGGTESTDLGAPADPWVFPVIFAVLAFVAVLVVSELAVRYEHRREQDLADDIQAT